MKAFKPFPWFETITEQIKASGPYDLRGDELIFSSDSSYKDGYFVDAMLCTDRASLIEWQARNEDIRKNHALDSHGLHYKDLRSNHESWSALWPTMKSASMLRGVAVIVRTPPQMVDSNVRIVEELRAKGLMSHEHDWKPLEYVKMVGLASLLGAIAGAVCTGSKSICWVSDSEPMFNNEEQLADIRGRVDHSLTINLPYSMGPVEVRTKRKPNHDQWAFDLVNILDLYAGSIGDLLKQSKGRDDNQRSHWEPGENERRNMNIGNIANWVLQDTHNPLKRHAFDLGPFLRDGDVIRHSVTVVSGRPLEA